MVLSASFEHKPVYSLAFPCEVKYRQIGFIVQHRWFCGKGYIAAVFVKQLCR
jgi:hypothetical protein